MTDDIKPSDEALKVARELGDQLPLLAPITAETHVGTFTINYRPPLLTRGQADEAIARTLDSFAAERVNREHLVTQARIETFAAAAEAAGQPARADSARGVAHMLRIVGKIF